MKTETDKINPGQTATVLCSAEGLPKPSLSNITLSMLTASSCSSKMARVPSPILTKSDYDKNNHRRALATYQVKELHRGHRLLCRAVTDVGEEQYEIEAKLFSEYFINEC